MFFMGVSIKKVFGRVILYVDITHSRVVKNTQAGFTKITFSHMYIGSS